MLCLWQQPKGTAIGINIGLAKIFPRHDLLIEIGRVEMALEQLSMRSQQERTLSFSPSWNPA